MITVALIGGDGAGKSTIAKKLRENFPLPLKYLYMGINIESSNIALPTSRYIERRKAKNGHPSPNGQPVNAANHDHSQNKKKKNVIWRYVRLANRFAEEWFRQMLSWNYRRQGFMVLYDRYFLFDFARSPLETDSEYKKRSLDDRLHRWVLQKFYPEPDMVIFLYAPPEVLFARKGEATLEYLDNLQKTFMKRGEKIKKFVQIDTSKLNENEVYKEVKKNILQFYESGNGKK